MFPSPCYALLTLLCSGQCRSPEALDVASTCSPVNPDYPAPVARCFANPCDVSPRCSNSYKVQCVARYCIGFFR